MIGLHLGENMKQTKLTDIYRLLLELYGNRGWWPGENQDEIAIGAILAQSVAWQNVEKALRNLKQRGVCSLAKLVELEQDELAALIVPTLYYNQKAERLLRFARYFQAEAGYDFARLFSGEINGLRSRLLFLKGLGPETVDSLLLYAGDRLVFVVDAYTRRLLYRLGLTAEKASYDELQDYICRRIPRDLALYKDFHAQIVCLCKDICKAKPRCGDCPLREVCQAGRSGSFD